MRPKFLASLIVLISVTMSVPKVLAQALDPATTFNLINAQQNYMVQQQMMQMQAMQEAQRKAQEDALKQQQFQGISQALVGACGAFFRSETTTAGGHDTSDLEDTAYATQEIAWAELEAKGHTYDPDLDQEMSKTVGAESTMAFKAGCDKFMNRDGKLGPWGSYALSLIRGNGTAFGTNVPDDITKWCPKYPGMNKTQRELYWVWILSAMASSESSCDPAVPGKGKNGTALGLFQVWKPVCPKARNLKNPFENIQCAVDLLADELRDRDTLMSTTSNGERDDATYWAVLRVDGRDKGNSEANRKTRAIMEKYKYCH